MLKKILIILLNNYRSIWSLAVYLSEQFRREVTSENLDLELEMRIAALSEFKYTCVSNFKIIIIYKRFPIRAYKFLLAFWWESCLPTFASIGENGGNCSRWKYWVQFVWKRLLLASKETFVNKLKFPFGCNEE